jgi:hypothetical protein
MFGMPTPEGVHKVKEQIKGHNTPCVGRLQGEGTPKQTLPFRKNAL